LILVIMAEAVGVLAVAAVGRTATWLDVGGAPGVGAERAEHRGRVEGPRPHLHVVGLKDDAALRAPVAVERQDQVLEAQAQDIAPPNTRRALADASQRGKTPFSLPPLAAHANGRSERL